LRLLGVDAHEVGDPVVLGPQTAEALDERAQALADDPDGAVGFAQRGEALDGGPEHVGFRGGISAVGVRGRMSTADRHLRTPPTASRTRPRWTIFSRPTTSATARPCPRCGCPATRRCRQTSLEDKLELFTARWMNQDRRPEVLAVSGHDVLVGQGPVRRRASRGSGGVTEPVTASHRWIVPTGGGYFFGRSLPTLRALADGADLS
jgi:hypothetical protein